MTAPSHHAPATVTTRREFLVIFSTVFLPMFLAAVDQTLLATATPSIVTDLGGLHLSPWIAIGYLLAASASVPFYGWLADRISRRIVLMLALAVFSIGCIIGGLAQSMPILILARVVQGLGSGGLMSVCQALVGEKIPPRQRIKYQGYFAMVFVLSSICGPVLGGFVVTHFSWHWLFWANLPLVVIATWRLLRYESVAVQDAPKKQIDIIGMLMLPIIISVFLYWLSVGGHSFPWLSLTSLWMIAAVLMLFPLFLLHQRRHSQPFLPLDLLKMPAIHVPLISSFLFAACMFSLIFFLPIYTQLVMKTTAATSGLLLLPMSMGTVCGSLITGKVVAKTGVPKWVPVVGMSVAAVGFLLLSLTPPTATSVMLLGILCGLGFGTVMPTTQIVIQTVGGKARLGATTSMASLARSIGAATGTAIFGSLLYAMLPGFTPHTSIATLMQGPRVPLLYAFQVGFFVAAMIAAITALNAARAPRIHLDDYR